MKEGIQLMNIERQHKLNAKMYEDAVLDALRSGTYIGGENVTRFEHEFAEYIGVKHAISVGNGTDALVIALRALGIGEGDEVITVSFTFFATAEAIAAVGATPVFIDVCKDTYCMDPDQIEQAITKKTKAVLPVHIYGQCADMDAINTAAKAHGLYVIEDACQAAGALYKGRKAGALGDVACFSFFPTKNLGCAGDGGMIATNDETIAQACAAYKSHGSGALGRVTLEKKFAEKGQSLPKGMPVGDSKYYNYLIGYNSRLDSLQAALLSLKLPMLDGFVDGRRENAHTYHAALKDKGYTLPYEAKECYHSYYVYVLAHPQAACIMEKIKKKGVPSGVYYPVPLHLQGAFLPLGYQAGDLPVTERLCATTFAIPVYPELKKEERNVIIEALLEAVRE